MGTTTDYYHKRKKQSAYQKARAERSDSGSNSGGRTRTEPNLRSGKNIEGYVDRRGRRKR